MSAYRPKPLRPWITGFFYSLGAMIAAAVVIAIGLAIGLHGVHGLDSLGPIGVAILAAVFGLPVAGLVGFFYGQSQGRLNEMEYLTDELEDTSAQP